MFAVRSWRGYRKIVVSFLCLLHRLYPANYLVIRK
jgi:hypothetical protein